MPVILTGHTVRELRLAAGVTQADLARALGYTRQAIYWWEHHPDRSIPRTQYERVLDALARKRHGDLAITSALQALYTAFTS